ncbi:MAG: ATP-binding protein [Chloroflexi bacterium AL-W]|nr:ATP-binding protein [Chloroflexi bacterium AL-N1]NOK66134.1 ATP-binding protein [Chloroflexi bacterium AL-N10]NOK73015.1 ATP-binding protein [Chloroflexi bacterium AL-N5]NOK79912.1 ATP-binding protein [Chloroflexi bacterium AL-W]NOK88232.1 ATP-binding protein [Chloroflexi bacterium AL-N15]
MMYQNTPCLIALKGHPGSGKSAIARALSRQLSIPLIDKDDIKDILNGICTDAGGLAYMTMFNIARCQLTQGLSVICDSPLSEVGGYTAASCVARDTGTNLVVVECICSSPEEWQRRIEHRAALRLPSHHITTWADLAEHLHRREKSSNYPIKDPYLIIDTVGSFDETVEQLITWLGHYDSSITANMYNRVDKHERETQTLPHQDV